MKAALAPSKNWYDGASPFEAIFAANDQMALGAREALQTIGLSVPGDVLLVGYDDIPLARYVESGTHFGPRQHGRSRFAGGTPPTGIDRWPAA